MAGDFGVEGRLDDAGARPEAGILACRAKRGLLKDPPADAGPGVGEGIAGRVGISVLIVRLGAAFFAMTLLTAAEKLRERGRGKKPGLGMPFDGGSVVLSVRVEGRGVVALRMEG